MTRIPIVSQIRRARRALARLHDLNKLDSLAEAIGRIEARQLDAVPGGDLRFREFTVYSQSGEDGILHHLSRVVPIRRRTFVEFGVGNYTQANTRYLALNDHWSGLVMEADAESVRQIRADPIYWRINVTAVHAMVTRENINDLLREHEMVGEIGLLSIDIDGNDYWVFQAIEVVEPAIVVVEYNSRFGPRRSVTIPYNPEFNRWRAHPSGIYAGASLRAMCNLAARKGYSFVGCNGFGVNAFFVRNDLVNDAVTVVSVDDGYVEGQFREGRDELGRLVHLGLDDEKRILDSLPLVELDGEEALSTLSAGSQSGERVT